jgi:hypothetical protein
MEKKTERDQDRDRQGDGKENREIRRKNFNKEKSQNGGGPLFS